MAVSYIPSYLLGEEIFYPFVIGTFGVLGIFDEE
jgi:hypothetical protein